MNFKIEKVRVLVKRLLPDIANRFISDLKIHTKIRLAVRNHRKLVRKIKHKPVISVAFLVIHESIWKYEELYQLMKADKRFSLCIFICPYISYGEKTMKEEMERAYNYFADRGYETISTFDEQRNTWRDIKNIDKPDIVFFTNPHKVTLKQYQIDNFLNVLTCYSPYAFVVIHKLEIHYKKHFHALLWKHFIETEFHRRYAEDLLSGLTKNTVVSGYPSLESIRHLCVKREDVWKVSDTDIKNIIWAPHHTINEDDSGLAYSTFLQYAEYFREFEKQYSQKIQIAFKPHPLLKSKLFLHPDWGVSRTTEYYESWYNIPNGQLEEGEYHNLFATSDALILDSASFLAEYLYTHRPLLFLERDSDLKSRLNSFGQAIYDHIYVAKELKEIEQFIQSVVVDGADYMQGSRLDFLVNQVMPRSGRTASENMYSEIKNEIS